ncbi:MAG: hypothetical protein JW837_13265 [Sedimentisphaerales bacterium]|nr:hypothetical protein [Sedimentisphaerales bacterium]
MINRNKVTILAAILLSVASILCMWLRIKYTWQADWTDNTRTWRLTYDISFFSTKADRIQIAIPDSNPNNRIWRETFSHEGILVDLLRNKRTKGRGASVVSMPGHKQGWFFAQFDIYRKAGQQPTVSVAEEKMSTNDRAYYLRDEKEIQIQNPILTNILKQLSGQKITKPELLNSIFDYCVENITKGPKDTFSDAASTLEHNTGTTLGRARAMVALCRASKIPARLVAGFILENTPQAQVHYWVEAFAQKSWQSYDPENGYSIQLPINFLPVGRDNIDIVRGIEALDYQSGFSIRQLLPPASLSFSQEPGVSNIIDLTRLPPSMQTVASLILLLPLAALITTIFRNIIGIQTIGTFSPGLIALSFVNADWRTGTVVFFIILSAGILSRLILNKLQLLMVARLSIILTLAVLCMVAAVSVLDYLSLTPSASAVVLPIVILTIMIERFNIIAEEDGLPNALKMFAATIFVAICCFLVMKVDWFGRIVLIFPEIQLFNIAILLSIGRYSGYRLSEIWRFHDITQTSTD